MSNAKHGHRREYQRWLEIRNDFEAYLADQVKKRHYSLERKGAVIVREARDLRKGDFIVLDHGSGKRRSLVLYVTKETSRVIAKVQVGSGVREMTFGAYESVQVATKVKKNPHRKVVA